MNTNITSKVRVEHRLIQSCDCLVQHSPRTAVIERTKSSCVPTLPDATGTHVEETTKPMTEYVHDQLVVQVLGKGG